MTAPPDDDEDRRLRELENRLYVQRPAPPLDFRTRLHQRLARRGFPKGRPRHLWPLAAGCAAGGVLLLGVAAALV